MRIHRVVYRFWHNMSTLGRVGYIGKDSYHPHRFSLERRSKEKGHPKLYRALKKYPLKVWYKEILASGFKSTKALNRAEIFYIKKFNSKEKGYNHTDGGDGNRGLSPSVKTREKIRKSLLGTVSPMRGKKYPPEFGRKISKAKMGKKMSPEGRAAISKANVFRGKHFSEEHKRKISEALKGRKLSDEHKRKLSEAAKNR
jgi:group I intron endonuclease